MKYLALAYFCKSRTPVSQATLTEHIIDERQPYVISYSFYGKSLIIVIENNKK